MVSLLPAAIIASPAQAAKPDTVSSVSVQDAASTLTLTFDKPVSRADAEAIVASRAPQVRVMAYDTIYCGDGGGYIDSNGSFSWQYYCNGSTKTIPWGFLLSASNQATVVGSVSETGLRWWCNSYFVGQNAPHTVPASYQFHGTMNPVAAGCFIDYQDYMTWRHNIGPGGTASLAIAGTFYLAN